MNLAVSAVSAGSAIRRHERKKARKTARKTKNAAKEFQSEIDKKNSQYEQEAYYNTKNNLSLNVPSLNSSILSQLAKVSSVQPLFVIFLTPQDAKKTLLWDTVAQKLLDKKAQDFAVIDFDQLLLTFSDFLSLSDAIKKQKDLSEKDKEDKILRLYFEKKQNISVFAESFLLRGVLENKNIVYHSYGNKSDRDYLLKIIQDLRRWKNYKIVVVYPYVDPLVLKERMKFLGSFATDKLAFANNFSSDVQTSFREVSERADHLIVYDNTHPEVIEKTDTSVTVIEKLAQLVYVNVEFSKLDDKDAAKFCWVQCARIPGLDLLHEWFLSLCPSCKPKSLIEKVMVLSNQKNQTQKTQKVDGIDEEAKKKIPQKPPTQPPQLKPLKASTATQPETKFNSKNYGTTGYFIPPKQKVSLLSSKIPKQQQKEQQNHRHTHQAQTQAQVNTQTHSLLSEIYF